MTHTERVRQSEAMLERAARAIAETNAALTRAGFDPGKPIGGEKPMIIHIKSPEDIEPSVEAAERLSPEEIEVVIPDAIPDKGIGTIHACLVDRGWNLRSCFYRLDGDHRYYRRPAPLIPPGETPTPGPMNPEAVLTDPFRPGRVPIGPEVDVIVTTYLQDNDSSIIDAGWLRDADRVDARNARRALVEKYLMTGEMDPSLPIEILTHLSPVRDFIEGIEG